MKLPPYIVRRMIIAPLLVVAVAFAVGALPLGLLIAAFLSRFVPGRWRILRVAWFLFVYLVLEALGLIVLFADLGRVGIRLETAVPVLPGGALRVHGVVAAARDGFRSSNVPDLRRRPLSRRAAVAEPSSARAQSPRRTGRLVPPHRCTPQRRQRSSTAAHRAEGHAAMGPVCRCPRQSASQPVLSRRAVAAGRAPSTRSRS